MGWVGRLHTACQGSSASNDGRSTALLSTLLHSLSRRRAGEQTAKPRRGSGVAVAQHRCQQGSRQRRRAVGSWTAARTRIGSVLERAEAFPVFCGPPVFAVSARTVAAHWPISPAKELLLRDRNLRWYRIRVGAAENSTANVIPPAIKMAASRWHTSSLALQCCPFTSHNARRFATWCRRAVFPDPALGGDTDIRCRSLPLAVLPPSSPSAP